MESKIEKLQNFTFFNKELMNERASQGQSNVFATLELTNIIVIESRIYACNKKKGTIHVFEILSETNNTSVYYKLVGILTPFKEKLDHFYRFTFNSPSGKQHYLFLFGQDLNEAGQKTNFLKIYEHSAVMASSNLETLDSRRSVLIGKTGVLAEYFSFAVSPDFASFALATKDGILLYKAKNIITDALKDTPIQLDKTPVKYISFATDPNAGTIGIYAATSNAIWVVPNINKLDVKKKVAQGSFKFFDVNDRGELIAVNENNQIHSFCLTDRLKGWPYDEEKLIAKCFGQNYLATSIKSKRDDDFVTYRPVIYDLTNLYFAYNSSTDSYTSVVDIYTGEPSIYVVITNSKNEKSIFRLTEQENSKKLEGLLRKNCFDIAYRFAENQQYDKSLLAEISLCNANHHYTKKEYQKAINEYKKTAGIIEPSYVIMKFLDVSQIDYLIQYLEHIHAEKLANKDHTALLLNCFVKQKNLKKFEEFLNSLQTFSSDIFDTQAAVKECRDLKHIDLALKLAQQCEHDDLYIRILIEDKKDYSKAIEHIRTKSALENKIKYIREYGQTLMKAEPQKTLNFIKLIVTLSTYKRIKFSADRPLLAEEKQIFDELCLQESEKDKLNSIVFPKPDDFFHFFVVHNDDLQKYLEFLKKQKNLSPDKNDKSLYPIFHKMFEFHLEKYSDYYKQNEKVLQHRKVEDEELKRLEKNLLDLLADPEHERKYDKNHILVLFKMFQFRPGIVILCQKMGLREELLNYYIEKKEYKKAVELCREHGNNEINLWVQALKHFSKLSKEERSFSENEKEIKSYITESLNHVQRIDNLSPLLVLNILGKTNNLSLGEVKSYFKRKLEENSLETAKNNSQLKENYESAQKNRADYRKLKTQAKIFQSETCNSCNDKIYSNEHDPAVYFMCGHAFHQSCLNSDKSYFECDKCAPELNDRTEKIEDLKKKMNENTEFFEKLENSKNKFDVIAEFMGRGLFGTFQADEEEQEDEESKHDS